MSRTLTRDIVRLVGLTFRDYRKRGVTPISDEILAAGDKIQTKEGITDAAGCRVALDADGDPYPIATAVFDKAYVPADVSPSQEEQMVVESAMQGLAKHVISTPDNRHVMFPHEGLPMHDGPAPPCSHEPGMSMGHADPERLDALLTASVSLRDDPVEWRVSEAELKPGITVGATVIGPGGYEYIVSRIWPCEPNEESGYRISGSRKWPQTPQEVQDRSARLSAAMMFDQPLPEALPPSLLIPCSERLPERQKDWDHSEWVLVYSPEKDGVHKYRHFAFAYYHYRPPFDEPSQWMAPGQRLPANITHWMPLPDQP